MSGGMGEKIKKILAIDGQKANHIVSAVDDGKFCLDEVLVMGCQTDIARLIRKRKADYMFSLKGNQSTLQEDVELYF